MLQLSNPTPLLSQLSRVAQERQGASLSADPHTQESLKRIKEQHPLSSELQKLLTSLKSKKDGITLLLDETLST
jgi:hypothetical protein